MKWVELAACRDLDHKLFFPTHGRSPARGQAICATCPVATQCLAFATATSQEYGIWGGVVFLDDHTKRRRVSRKLVSSSVSIA